MASAATRTVGKTVVNRMTGSRPGSFKSLIVAVIVGAGTAALTYKMLRSGG